jgi:flagellar M-ring protein FliF
MMDRVTKIWANFAALGSRKLAALGLIFALVAGAVSFSAYYLSRPNLEVLYAGLDRDDISRIGATLKAAGIYFDVNPEGNAISVHYGETAQARMLLAERGLPQSANAGYELFDKVGALGLTSFMKEVTRVRALEGELARTIQLIRRVKAARVHIVMPDEGSFRRAKQQPSASVIIRTEGPDDSSAAQAIRHLVAASIPGMTVDQVAVLNTDGVILMSTNGEPFDAVPAKTLTLERTVAKDIQDNVRKTLAPYLSLPNFQVSVRARLNTDRRQVNETTYDPESRVERSVRVVKENSISNNNSTSNTTSVERNIPLDKPSAADGKQSNDENKKSEELTNFEVSSKSVTTVSSGYTVEHLSIAVLINRKSLLDANKESASPQYVEHQLKEIEQLVASAAGLKTERGDTLKISAVDFTFNEHEIGPAESASWGEILGRNFGSIINGAALLCVTSLVVIFGLIPTTRVLIASSPLGSPETPALLENASAASITTMADPAALEGYEPELIEDLPSRMREAAQRKLERMIASNEAQAAAILKKWMRTN